MVTDALLALAAVFQAAAAVALVWFTRRLQQIESRREPFERMGIWSGILNLTDQYTRTGSDAADDVIQDLLVLFMENDLEQWAGMLGKENPELARRVFERIAELGVRYE